MIYFSNSLFWEEKTVPFDELILSWNGVRPLKGKWTFWVSIQGDEWLKYAEWGAHGQRSFQNEASFSKCHQDLITMKSEIANSFRVKVVGEEKEKLQRLIASVSQADLFQIHPPEHLPPVFLKRLSGLSQMRLNHPRHKDLCSPTSIVNALQYFQRFIDPINFAQNCYDQGFDIYGNWVLNVAEAYHQSGIPCHVERLADFKTLHQHLSKGRPVITSIKGSLSGAPKPYPSGHLCCVVGYEKKRVFVQDPAFHEDVFTSYDLNEFLKAWGERRNLAYIFSSDLCI